MLRLWLGFWLKDQPKYYWRRLFVFECRKKTLEATALARKLRRMRLKHEWIVEVVTDVYGSRIGEYVHSLRPRYWKP